MERADPTQEEHPNRPAYVARRAEAFRRAVLRRGVTAGTLDPPVEDVT
jgi:hypothetical protein